jgi:3-oxoadipate enol-lactonase
MTAVMIGGEEFHILVEGSEGRPVLMLSNPLGTHLHFWDPQVPALLEHFRLVRYDSRGHGKTLAGDGHYALDQLGQDALAIADALGIAKFHWLGLSIGSVVGLWLLIHARSRIGRALLAGTAAQIPGPDMWNSRVQSARDFGMESVSAAAAERWFTKRFRETEPAKVERVLAMVRATEVQGYTAACGALRDMDLREAIRGITNEVLVIAGRRDLSTPPGMGALVASSIEGAKLVTLDAPHMSNIEDEGNFTKAVLDFLTAPASAAPKAPSGTAKPTKKAAAKVRAPMTAARKIPAKKAPPKGALPKQAAKKAGTRKSAKRSPAKNRNASKKAAIRVKS